jgi:hypothetical protein
MNSFIRSIALAGLLSVGFAGGAVLAQDAAPVPAVADLQAAVTAACAGVTSLDAAPAECRAALVLLLAYYPEDPAVITFVSAIIGDEAVVLLAAEVEAQQELLGIETGAILGAPGGAPGTPS